ncbi:MAG: hypothetical protein ACRBF0_24930 [Calditrichia bacterium]
MEDLFQKLEKICQVFPNKNIDTKIIGEGIGCFVVVGNDQRAVELYPNTEEGTWVLDPALGEELLGELDFASLGEAISAAEDWILSGGKKSFLKTLSKVPDVEPDEHDKL